MMSHLAYIEKKNERICNFSRKFKTYLTIICCPVLHNVGVSPNKNHTECLDHG